MKTLEVNIKKMTGINKCEVIVVTSVEHITRDVNFGWLLRYCHQVGASMFFVVVYIHIFQQETYHEFFFKKKKSIYHIICYAFSSNSFWVFCVTDDLPMLALILTKKFLPIIIGFKTPLDKIIACKVKHLLILVAHKSQYLKIRIKITKKIIKTVKLLPAMLLP